MLTTCPECHTTFRVAHDQLQRRQGMVRCGYCRAVFNAYDTLLPEFDQPEEVETPSAPQPEPGPAPKREAPWMTVPVAAPGSWAAPSELETIEIQPAPYPPEEAQVPELPVEFETPEPTEPSPLFEPPELPESTPPFEPPGPPEPPFPFASPEPLLPEAPEPSPQLTAYDEVRRLEQMEPAGQEASLSSLLEDTPDAILLSELPTRSRIRSEQPFWQTALFVLLDALLILALAGQAAFFFRGPIASWQPDLRPYLEQACQPLGCSVPLDRDLSALKVESSSLETDPEQPTRARLKVSFSNRSRFALVWPDFVLKLSDLKGAPLAQRVFPPADYLPKDKPEAAGMAPMSEQEFHLDLDLGGLPASGYEIKPQYP